MSIILGSVTVPGSSTVVAFRLPSGLCNFTLYQPSTPQAVYVGPSSAITSSTGMPVPVTPSQQETYVSNAGMTYYATTGNATASSFMYLISTGN